MFRAERLGDTLVSMVRDAKGSARAATANAPPATGPATAEARSSAALGAPIDKSSPVPLYFQIAENLRAAIESGALRPGDQLENEVDIGTGLGVSRPTVRQAIQRLVAEGLLARRRGVGTVVVNRRIQRALALSSLYEDLVAAGRHPTTTVLSVQEIGADDEVAAALSVLAGDPVVKIERLRSADGRPLAVMRNYLLVERLKAVEPEVALSQEGLYEILRRQGVQFHSAEEVIAARRATASEALLLQAPRNTTVLTMTRTAADTAGRAIEYGNHAYRADLYSFRVTLSIR